MIRNAQVDLQTFSRTLLFYAVGGTLWCAVMAPIVGVPGSVMMVIFLVALGATTTVSQADEANHWLRTRAVMPSSRSQVVTGRYFFAAATLLGAAAVWSTLGAGMSWALRGTSVGELAATPLVAWAVGATCSVLILLVLAVWFPLSYRFGNSSAMLYVPIVLMIVPVMLLGFLMGSDDTPQWILRAVTYFYDPALGGLQVSHVFTALGIGAVIVAALYVGSCALSVRFLSERDL